MLITYECERGLQTISNINDLISALQSGEISIESRVFDTDKGQYTILGEMDEIKSLAVNDEINKYLGYQIGVVKELRKKKIVKRISGTTADIISIIFLLFGILINIYFKLFLLNDINMEPATKGYVIGGMLGKVLFFSLLWLAIWNKSRKNNRKAVLIIFSIFAGIFLAIT